MEDIGFIYTKNLCYKYYLIFKFYREPNVYAIYNTGSALLSSFPRKTKLEAEKFDIIDASI